MKIWILENKKIFNSRDEVLVKIDFNDHIGFCSYSPWEHLGQRSLSLVRDDLKALKSEMIGIAWKDAFIFQKYKETTGHRLKNHTFYHKELIKFSSDVLKLKLSGKIEQDINLVQEIGETFSRIRLDANYKYSIDDFLTFWARISLDHHKVEYIEDPIAWNESDYKKLLNLKVPIALDQIFNNEQVILNAGERLVLKPIIQSVNSQYYKKCIFSHNMNGALSDWQSFCELIRIGDLTKTHGVASTSSFNRKKLFTKTGELVEINTPVIKEIYDHLYSLKDWEKVSL